MDMTRFVEVEESTIPLYHFSFASFQEILDANREDNYIGKLNEIFLHSDIIFKSIQSLINSNSSIYYILTYKIGHMVEKMR
jgi:hypothetical protein